MRSLMAFVLMTLLVPGVALAQTDQADTSKKLIKILVGGSALAIGATVAARSSQTTTVTSPIGQTQTSSFSATQLATGLAIAGAGSFVVWSALKADHPSSSISVGIAAGKAKEVFVRRTW